MKKTIVLVIWMLMASVRVWADEGLWLPQLLAALNEKQMKKMGMKISAADIYSINKSSLKDAIVSFGGFCTAEVISGKGLILTNHHCGFDAIQNHSTLEKNYLRNGFWAMSHAEELPNPGLTATFIIRIDDVTSLVLDGITAGMPENERQSQVDKNILKAREAAVKESWQDVMVRPFFEGNKYYLFVTETFKDVRLVGAPPSAIGNFGKDTDNWMWPRHTGDFSLFRIYAGKDNKPAPYSAENVPYVPRRSLNISLDGVKEGDFTMVFGFPGRTTQYLHSAAVEQIMTVNDPAKIALRDRALKIMDGFMRGNEQVRIQYAAKYASVENAYKKWKGEVLGLRLSGALDKKRERERLFAKLVAANPGLQEKYGNLLSGLEEAYAAFRPYGYARDYYNEVVPRIELFTVASALRQLQAAQAKGGEALTKTKAAVQERINDLFREYSPVVDQRLFEQLLEMYLHNQPDSQVSPMLKQLLNTYQHSFPALGAAVYRQTVLTDAAKLQAFINSPDIAPALAGDTAYLLFKDVLSTYTQRVAGKLNELQARINNLQRTYVQAQLDVFKDKVFYPDANGTLRVTYGNVKPYKPRDGVQYHFYTYLDGVMEKYKPGDYEFDVPEKLIDLYRKKDYGPYGVQGRQPVCFIAANHTTGGNSGSPALDAHGNLIGLNFDRVWEGTMSDINYDSAICRNIMVDIRYVLFIIDKFAGADHLIQELKLVSTKKPKRK